MFLVTDQVNNILTNQAKAQRIALSRARVYGSRPPTVRSRLPYRKLRI